MAENQGREKFIATYRAFLAPRAGAIEKEWDALPAGFRKLLAVQSRQPELADKKLSEMSRVQLEKLSAAADQLAGLCVRAGSAVRRFWHVR